MKIKIKNIFNAKDTNETKLKVEKHINEKKEPEKIEVENKKRRRKGAYDNSKIQNKLSFKEGFENLFKNKKKLSKGYYVLLFFMLLLGGASVAITFKAYNLFAKEDYELYASDSKQDSEDETVSTISNIDNNNENKNDSENNNTNAAEAKVEKKSSTNSTTSSSKNTNKQNKVTVKPLSFAKPISGEIQKPYSIDKVIYSKTLELWKTHDGIDISAQVGTSVKSIEKGTVEKIYEDSFYGFTVVIDHGQGYKSSYSNLNKSINIKEKQTISKGQIIGKIAKTSIGEIKDEPHLHFTLFKDNNNVDPTYIFK